LSIFAYNFVKLRKKIREVGLKVNKIFIKLSLLS